MVLELSDCITTVAQAAQQNAERHKMRTLTKLCIPIFVGAPSGLLEVVELHQPFLEAKFLV